MAALWNVEHSNRSRPAFSARPGTGRKVANNRRPLESDLLPGAANSRRWGMTTERFKIYKASLIYIKNAWLWFDMFIGFSSR